MAEVSIRSVGINAAEIHTVEEIEGIYANIEREPLPDLRYLVQAGIGFSEARIAEAIDQLVSFGAQARQSERSASIQV